MTSEKKKSSKGEKKSPRSLSTSPSKNKSKNRKSKGRGQEKAREKTLTASESNPSVDVKTKNNRSIEEKKPKTKTESNRSVDEKPKGSKTKLKINPEKSKSGKKKPILKGLSPPKEINKKKRNRDSPSKDKKKDSSLRTLTTEPSELHLHGMDTTQWENGRYKDEAIGIVEEDPNVYVKDKIGEATPFLAEQKQVMVIRGEHLKNKPIYTLFFLFLEIIFGLTVLIAWSFFLNENEFIPVLLCYSNILILLIDVLILFVIQFGRFNVVEEELDDDKRYRIPYNWKYWICVMHLLRFFLICSNITIGALDNNFDGGVIVLISAMPIMLILSAGHVFFALRPQG